MLISLTDLAESAEFEVYQKYADDITSAQSKEALQSLLLRQDVSIIMIQNYTTFALLILTYIVSVFLRTGKQIVIGRPWVSRSC